MGDFELDLLLDLGCHVPVRFIHILRCAVEEIKIDNRTSRGVARYQPPRREAGKVSFLPLAHAGDVQEKEPVLGKT
jgi:hypothetical protein